LAVASDVELRIWDISGETPIKGQKITWERCQSVEFSADGTKVVTANRNDGQLAVWDLDNNRQIVRFFHPASFLDASLSHDGKTLFSKGGNEACIWDVDRSRYEVASGRPYWYVPLAVSPDGKLVATGSSLNGLTLWDVTSGLEREFRHGSVTGSRALEARVRCLDFSSDGVFILSGANDRLDNMSTVRILNLSDGSEDRVFEVDGLISALACSPNGKHFASAAAGGQLQLWSMTRGKPQTLRDTPGHTVCLGFSPDGSYLATSGDRFSGGDPASQPGIVEIWDVRGDSPHSLKKLEHSGGAWALAWSPDGRLLATAKTDGALTLWDASTWMKKRSYVVGDLVTSIGFSNDGKTLAACSPFVGVIRFWETDTGNEVGTLRLREKCRKLAFLPGGNGMVSASIEGVTRLWRAVSPGGSSSSRKSGD
jgi:WD40 repeat protein